MGTDDEKPEPTVKQLLDRGLDKPLGEVVDAVTAAELERWFGLPSFQQVEESAAKAPEEDPDVAAVRERRAKATAAVDPAMLEAHRRRTDPPDDLMTFKALIEISGDRPIGLIDLAMMENRASVAEPREVERPEDIEEQLKEATPQALLRDLHRPELEFDKELELVDMAAEQRIDIVAAVAEALATSWKLPPLEEPPTRKVRKLLAEVRAEIDGSWAAILTRIHLPNRRVEE